jgi:hypothetical protein
MNVSGLDPVQAVEHAVKVEKISQSQQKLEGEAAVKLIEAAAPDKLPGPDPEGRGRLLNTTA